MASPEDKFFRARVIRREEFGPDLWMARIDPAGDFKFVPGRYATLGIEKDGKRIERPYSIVSSPAEQEIEFFFELVPEGALTPPALQTAVSVSYTHLTLPTICSV